jgi:hypothetical protein
LSDLALLVAILRKIGKCAAVLLKVRVGLTTPSGR